MRSRNAFTLVEILIVVVILGILSAVVVPQFTHATEEAASTATLDQLVKLREAISVYYVRNGSQYPTITTGDATWGELVAAGGDYMKVPPKNKWVGGGAETLVAAAPGATADPGWQAAHGWIYNTSTGELWAGSFDAADHPFPRP